MSRATTLTVFAAWATISATAACLGLSAGACFLPWSLFEQHVLPAIPSEQRVSEPARLGGLTTLEITLPPDSIGTIYLAIETDWLAPGESLDLRGELTVDGLTVPIRLHPGEPAALGLPPWRPAPNPSGEPYRVTHKALLGALLPDPAGRVATVQLRLAATAQPVLSATLSAASLN